MQIGICNFLPHQFYLCKVQGYIFYPTFLNPLSPVGSYMIHGPYGRNNCSRAKELKLIDQEWSISI